MCCSLKLKNASLWSLSPGNLVRAHSTTINSEPSKLVGECIFYALKVRTQTILLYSWKYRRELNLAVEPKIAIAADLNLAVQYGIAICIYTSRKF